MGLGELALSPAGLLVGVVVVVTVVYFLVPSKPSPPPRPATPPREPRKPVDMTAEELAAYNGVEGSPGLYVAVMGKIFDMSRGKDFYGPGGPYAVFAGRDATVGLATMELDPSKWGSIDDLTFADVDTANDWCTKFEMKYDFVGNLVKSRATEAVRTFTTDELAQYTGEKGAPGLYLGLMGQVFDVSPAASMYGPGAGYHVFAGRDATYGLGAMQLDPSQWQPNSALTESQLETARNWASKLAGKYTVVGKLVDNADDGEESKSNK